MHLDVDVVAVDAFQLDKKLAQFNSESPAINQCWADTIWTFRL